MQNEQVKCLRGGQKLAEPGTKAGNERGSEGNFFAGNEGGFRDQAFWWIVGGPPLPLSAFPPSLNAAVLGALTISAGSTYAPQAVPRSSSLA